MSIKTYLPSKQAIKTFIKDNRWFLFRFGLMAVTFAAMPDSACFAQQGSDDQTVDVITKPMKTMETLMTGPVAKGIVTIGAAVGGASWALNIDNQAVKTAMRVVGGGSVALGAATFVSQTTGIMIP